MICENDTLAGHPTVADEVLLPAALPLAPSPFDAVELKMRQELRLLRLALAASTDLARTRVLEDRNDRLATALKTVFETRLGYVRLHKRHTHPQQLADFCKLYTRTDWLTRVLQNCQRRDAPNPSA